MLFHHDDIDLVHIIQIQIEYLSKLYYIMTIVFFESCGVDTLHNIAHMSRNLQIHYHLWTLAQVNPFLQENLVAMLTPSISISFIPIHQDHFWHHLDLVSLLHQTTLSSSHIFKVQLSYLSKMCCISIIRFCSCYCGIRLLHTIAHFILHVSNRIFELYSQISTPCPLIPVHLYCTINLQMS
jgi:hypothetical protein